MNGRGHPAWVPPAPIDPRGVVSLSAPSLFYSPFAAYQVLVRSERKIYTPDGMSIIDVIPPLTAEFARHDGEFDYTDDTGMTRKGAMIRGNFFDLDVAAEENGWSDEDKETVRKVLLRQCQISPEQIRVHEPPKAAAPWPTYDDTHHNKIPVLASELGLLNEAIAYERQNKNRESVVAALEEKKQAAVAVEELTAV